ncbi:MAG: AAA family ATPase [Candidatus Margulisbacteria bacterium]|jgi:chromosome segregation protein|nr:AAA family ATPase [Candidatus Margulisiibacteriota bacterium]
MFLKSLTLRGFKTFAEGTEIEFGPDARITAVVGPNGCGKSNVLDATRWVLGEDNPRHLRVAALSDIIFAGTARRKPLSLAEISLLFDNSSGKLPVPFSEVSIKRRTFREGESEFFINKNLCRLKDIKDLLLDTGLGEGTYSIMTQGQVDAILSSKGEERRAVFEEAAGINKYKTRKLNAEKKLIAAEQNLLRINDLKVEVGEHLINLEDQARRAREYLQVQGRVKELEVGLIKKLAGSLLEKRCQLEAELSQARAAAAAEVAAEQQSEAAVITLKEQLRGLEAELEEQAVKLDAEKDRLRDAELNRRFIESEISREENQLASLEAKQSELQQKIAELKTQQASGADPAADDLPLGGAIQQLIADAHQAMSLLSAVIAYFGQESSFQLVGRQDLEATYSLQNQLLSDELNRTSTELERIRFGLQAHRSEITAISPAGQPEQAKSALQDRIGQLKGEREQLGRQVAELEEGIRQRERAERAKGEATAALEIQLAKIEGEMLGLTEKLSGEYSLTLPELETLPDLTIAVGKARTDVEEGKRRLRSLEPVNLLAIEEFDKTRERLSFIDAQLSDLGAARENLKNLIVELDQRAEENFVRTMEQLSIIFSETFAKLFAGGEARINLTPGVSVLEADIEISVRPSGRRWLPLTLLSGGERSLSAIAILFSLMKIRPSPFCFLDEVDAALDEANIGRFANMLKDFSATTQIIVITHNKRTMAVADNIYGVTMEEPGISKVISMKLTEAAV